MFNYVIFRVSLAYKIFEYINPSISLMVACYSIDEVNAKWKALDLDALQKAYDGE